MKLKVPIMCVTSYRHKQSRLYEPKGSQTSQGKSVMVALYRDATVYNLSLIGTAAREKQLGKSYFQEKFSLV